MVTITRATIINSFPIFIRDVLRNNLVDTQSPARTASDWIFKEEPEDRDFDPPRVKIELDTNFANKINMEGTKREPPNISIMVTVWARKMEYRDTIAGQIKTILMDVTKTDGVTSIRANNLIFKNYDVDINTVTIPKFPKLVREAVVTLEYDYIGT